MTSVSSNLIGTLIARIDSIPSTHLYFVAVATSIIFSFLLLNSGDSTMPPDAKLRLPADLDCKDQRLRRPARTGGGAKGTHPTGPEPKWHILKILNYAAVTSFTASVMYFASDYSRFLSDSASLFKFLFGWSAFLVFFFGFFGISFVDADGLLAHDEEEARMRQRQHMQYQMQQQPAKR